MVWTTTTFSFLTYDSVGSLFNRYVYDSPPTIPITKGEEVLFFVVKFGVEDLVQRS